MEAVIIKRSASKNSPINRGGRIRPASVNIPEAQPGRRGPITIHSIYMGNPNSPLIHSHSNLSSHSDAPHLSAPSSASRGSLPRIPSALPFSLPHPHLPQHTASGAPRLTVAGHGAGEARRHERGEAMPARFASEARRAQRAAQARA